MKLITTILPPAAVETVKEALLRFGIRGITVSPVYTDAPGGGHVEVYRGKHWQARVIPAIRLEIVTADADSDDIVHVITRTLQTTDTDALIQIMPVDYLIRIRTGEWGLAAL